MQLLRVDNATIKHHSAKASVGRNANIKLCMCVHDITDELHMCGVTDRQTNRLTTVTLAMLACH